MSKKNRLLQYCIHYIFNAILLIVSLAFLLPSCQREIIPDLPDPGTSGKDGNLQYNLIFAEYGAENKSESTTRSLKSESIVIPIGNDRYLYATLSEDPKVETPRVTTRAFQPNAKIRIIAYKDNSGTLTFADSALYRVNSGVLTRESTNTYMYLPAPGPYIFVAYSYNNVNNPPLYSTSISNIDPENDLIWGVSSSTSLQDGVLNTVPITMSHKLSLIKVVMTTGSGGPNITGISNMTMPGYNVNMVTETGALSNGTTTVQTIITSATPNNPTYTATERTVFTGNPAANPTIVNIGSLTISGKPTLPNVTAAFAKALQSGYSYTLTMKIGDSPDITDDTPPEGFIPYVGAFWKAQQRGERLIRMPRVANAKADGAWTAQVIQGKDWIQLDTVMTKDLNVGWRTDVTPNEANILNGNDPGFETPTYRLTGSSTFVSGMLGPGGTPEIYFRIGLTDVYNASPPNAPARYGMVLLTYANNSLRQRIWIRQGEESDYVPGMNNGTRWSPYNMMFVEDGGGSGDLSGPPPLGGGIGQHGLPAFTAYPTQAGYFYQWTNLPSVAYNPVNPVNTTPTGWDTGYQGPFQLGSVCPSGYIVPSGGPTSDMESLVTASRVAGYYADGWFDRRNITQSVTGLNGLSMPLYNLAVSATTADVGYAGVLFFNEVNLKSVFFPFAGYRVGINEYMSSSPGEGAPAHGALLLAGRVGNYWTSTATTGSAPEDNNSAFFLNLDFIRPGNSVASQIGTGTGRHMKGYGHSIRCVRPIQ